jgi:hypothetical protein
VGNSLDEGENILYQGIFRSLVYAMAWARPRIWSLPKHASKNCSKSIW